MGYGQTAMGQLLSNGANNVVYLPFDANSLEVTNYTLSASGTGVNFASWNSDMAQGDAIVSTLTAGAPVITALGAGGNGFSTFSAGTNFFGAVKTGSGITQAAAAVVTITAHGYQTGDVVLLYGTTGMLQVSGVAYTITRTGANTFTIPVNSSGFAAAATAVSAKKVLYPSLYFPGTNFITAITVGATTTVTTSAPHKFVVGQEVAFHISSNWGTTQLDSNTQNSATNPQYFFVTSVPTANTFVCNAVSAGFTAFAYPTSAVYATGVTPAQVCAVGDNNTGGGSNGTINGPAIFGSFVNNTGRGFIIGSAIGGASTNVLYWKAQSFDLVS